MHRQEQYKYSLLAESTHSYNAIHDATSAHRNRSSTRHTPRHRHNNTTTAATGTLIMVEHCSVPTTRPPPCSSLVEHTPGHTALVRGPMQQTALGFPPRKLGFGEGFLNTRRVLPTLLLGYMAIGGKGDGVWRRSGTTLGLQYLQDLVYQPPKPRIVGPN